ncbi:MAG: hypothetical protein EXX96DRAFT_606521 [Benjaminiella poitrasii]|nr:MAG: hypothetical protein EXX96DRAFT_606521 [Benjaminiella poitrasii]
MTSNSNADEAKSENVVIGFKSRALLSLIFQHSNYTISLISATSLCRFWSSTMLLPARSLWYRVFCKKLPTSAFLYSIGISDTTRCRLCSTSYDSINHFLVNCPPPQTSNLERNYSNLSFCLSHRSQCPPTYTPQLRAPHNTPIFPYIANFHHRLYYTMVYMVFLLATHISFCSFSALIHYYRHSLSAKFFTWHSSLRLDQRNILYFQFQ